MDRLFAMNVFVKAVELGSFSAAAEALRLSPQLAGKQIRLLEQHLGVQLLHRSTRRQSLTEPGRSFYERSKVILAEMEAAEGLAAEAVVEPTGRLRINAPVSFGTHTLAAALPDYIRDNPAVSVELSLSNRVIDLVDEGYDIVFRVGDLPDSGLIARTLAPYRLILCAAPSYLARSAAIAVPADLETHDCLGFSHARFSTQWRFEGPEGWVSVPVSGPMMADHGDPLLSAGLAGLGVLLLPSEVVTPALADGRLVELLPGWRAPAPPMHLLYSPDRRQTPKLRSFIDFAVKRFG